MTISTKINNGLSVPLMCYLFIILIFKTLAAENIGKILMTGPRLVYLCKLLLSSAGFFQNNFFKKIFQEHYQSVQIRTNVLSVLIWVHTFCKGYQQKINVASKERAIISSSVPYMLYSETCLKQPHKNRQNKGL